MRHCESVDLIERELDVPTSQVLTLYGEDVWEEIYCGKSQDWPALFTNTVTENVGALLRVLLDPSWAAQHLIPVKYSK